MTCSSAKIERARALLGTTVAIRVHGLRETDANHAIDEAFAEVALVHRLMSFHEPTSDVSRLNRDAHKHAVEVHPATFDVLRAANEISRASDGAFDITIAPRLVDARLLPPPDAKSPTPDATWQDISLGPLNHVRFHRRLWIDLGGIAKGFAVDRAVELLETRGALQACVNAGGDLAVSGESSECVALRLDNAPATELPVLEIENAALASSGSLPEQQRGVHIDGRTGRSLNPELFVSVVAKNCVRADALTKVVLALREDSQHVLLRYGAAAHLYEPRRGWRHFGA